MFKTLISPHEFLSERNLPDTLCQKLKRCAVTARDLEMLWHGNDVPTLVNFFHMLNLLLPTGIDVEGNKTFIVPCMLASRKMDMYETELFRTMSKIYRSNHTTKSAQPLLVGTFHQLLSICSNNWGIFTDDHLSYTDACFEIQNDVRLALTLLDDKSIHASIWCKKENLGSIQTEVILRVRGHLQECMNDLNISSPVMFYLMCPSTKPEDEETCMLQIMEMPDPVTSQPILRSIQKCFIHHQDFSSTIPVIG